MRILESAKQINLDEWQFFLKGGSVLDRSQQPMNPATSWLSEEAWDNITELENLSNFRGVVNSFESDPSKWEAWYRQQEPECSELPGDWESKCNELQHMVFVRSLRWENLQLCPVLLNSSVDSGYRSLKYPALLKK